MLLFQILSDSVTEEASVSKDQCSVEQGISKKNEINGYFSSKSEIPVPGNYLRDACNYCQCYIFIF